MIGKPLTHFLPELSLTSETQNILSRLITSGRRQYMVNCVRLSEKNDQPDGFIITFRDIENIQEDEGRIRKQLHSKGLRAKYHFEHIVGNSRIMKETIRPPANMPMQNLMYLFMEKPAPEKNCLLKVSTMPAAAETVRL